MKAFRLFNLLMITLLLVFCGCGGNPLDVDVSDIEAEVKINRLEKKLFEAEFKDLKPLNEKWLNEYGELWEAYITVMLRGGSPYDSLIDVTLEKFTADEIMRQVYEDIQKKFPDLTDIESEISKAFKHLIYYYPNAKVPKFASYNSVFNFGVFTTDSCVGIGLDMYLGPDNRIVKQISNEDIPQFIKDKMRKEYIAIDVMRGWFALNFMEEPVEEDFIHQIIQEGKILYALDAFFPDKEDHEKIRFTESELQWCIDNEMNIWKDIVDRELLYTKDQKEITPFLSEAPFTSGLPQDSPPRVGAWLGWQMVRAYMEDNSDLKLPDLINEKNARKILKSYKPEK